MGTSEDKNWASKYLLDPLNAPSPASETGPGTHFLPPSTPTVESTTTPAKMPSPPSTGNKLSKNPYRKASTASDKNPYTSATIHELPQQTISVEDKGASYPSPPASTSPRGDKFPPSATHPRDFADENHTPIRRRGSSLSSRFPGDMSHHPLSQIQKEVRVANHAPHLKKHHQIRPDPIDALDMAAGPGGMYHHEGPFDATYFARNSSKGSSPVEALKRSNKEALKATPPEKIMDSLRSHKPLDGIGAYSPGERDANGHVYNYKPGENMMIEGGIPDGGGAYKRWPGVDYAPDDIEGKGEPRFSMDKARQSHKKSLSGDIELVNRRKSATPGSPKLAFGESTTEIDGDGQSVTRRSSTTSKRLSGTGEGLKRRIGSIKKHLHHESSA